MFFVFLPPLSCRFRILSVLSFTFLVIATAMLFLMSSTASHTLPIEGALTDRNEAVEDIETNGGGDGEESE